MARPAASEAQFLFLQGPHGPFFSQLGKMVQAAGAEVWRLGFNVGDQRFWPRGSSYIGFAAAPEDWPATLRDILAEKNITDLVLYGDTRPVHKQAVEIAKELGLTVHVFEEGYLRPYWVTYERGGSNGHSRLMQMSVADMQKALARAEAEVPEAPGHWGNLREHVFYGALYHAYVLFGNRRYRHYQSHRDITVAQEFRLYLKSLVLMPWHWFDRVVATQRVKWGGFPYHLALLQLEHDASFRDHSPYASMAEFVEVVIEGFASSARRHHHLVFKAHPLEDGRVPLRHEIRRLARKHGVQDRVHYVRGGKLAYLLNNARSAVSVNSTAAQQVLWRGLPMKTFGSAIYDKPEFVSRQSLEDFFALPSRPDSRAYRDYRLYLLETSQVAGGFYSARGRRQLLRQVVDMMLDQDDPYDALVKGTAAPRQQLSSAK